MMEKNRKKLIDALKKLPHYIPEKKVWENIEYHLDKKAAAGSLPALSKIDPPEEIGQNIENELARTELLSTLPQYEPPVEIWEKIDRKLTSGKTLQLSKRIPAFLRWTTVAAAMLIFAFFIFKTIDRREKYHYSEEWVKIQDVRQWEKDDLIMEQALTVLCDENPSTCETTDFKELQKELQFLNQAKQEIIKQLNKYDSNTDLELKLTEIELEKSDLIKEMIAKTI